MIDYKIYSVESRKGGVGKTTVALNLAKTLIGKGYDVLLIDCDITGTPISEAAKHSPFWKDCITVATDNEGVSQNLIGYYERFFLNGHRVSEEFVKSLAYKRDMIHLVGSEIYDDEGNLIIDPRNLMDDMHSYWFLDMIKDISKKFSEIAESEQVAVVLDNSPGYVGIGRSLREWLTSLGPDKAHFVLVSSLDEQDIDSTISSATEIQRMMMEKFMLAKYSLQTESKDLSASTKVNEMLNAKKYLSNFFYELAGGMEYPSDTKKEYKVSDYIKVIINKVPDDYLEEGKGYHFDDKKNEDRKVLIQQLFPIGADSFPTNIVKYDNAISGQFIESSLERPVTEDQESDLGDEFKRFESRLATYESKEDKYGYVTYLYNAFHSVLDKLDDSGYKRMKKLLEKDFLPEASVMDMADNVRQLGNMAYSKMEKTSFSKEGMIESIKQQMRQFIHDFGLTQYSSVLLSQLDGILKKAGAERKNGNIFQLFNLIVMMRLVINRHRKLYKIDDKYRMFLKNEIMNGSKSTYDWNILESKAIQVDKEKLIQLDSELTDMMNAYYRYFYPTYCYNILKLIDCASDFQLIVNACRDTIGYGARIMSDELEDYLRDVVVKKSEEYNEKTYKEKVSEPFEMKAIQELLVRHVIDD